MPCLHEHPKTYFVSIEERTAVMRLRWALCAGTVRKKAFQGLLVRARKLPLQFLGLAKKEELVAKEVENIAGCKERRTLALPATSAARLPVLVPRSRLCDAFPEDCSMIKVPALHISLERSALRRN